MLKQNVKTKCIKKHTLKYVNKVFLSIFIKNIIYEKNYTYNTNVISIFSKCKRTTMD